MCVCGYSMCDYPAEGYAYGWAEGYGVDDAECAAALVGCAFECVVYCDLYGCWVEFD